MKAKVTEQGVMIPKGWLKGIDEVEIWREGDRIILMPIVQHDPIWDLGANPVNCGVTDASENHDMYLHGSF